MAFSIYEIDGYQDIAKPSDLLGENDLSHEVFHVNRPDSPNDKSKHNDEIDGVQFDDQSYNYSPSNWDQQDSYLVNKAHEIIAEYRLEHDPIHMSFNMEKEGRVKVAVSIADLMRATSKFSRQRAPRTNLRILKEDKKNRAYRYLVRGYEDWSDKKGHQVAIRFILDPKVLNLNAQQIKVSCSCPFWKYRGPDFNADRQDYLEGKPYSNLKFPDKQDPKLENLICKHVYAVGSLIEKSMIKNNLDTQKEVDSVLETLVSMKNTFLPEITIEGVEDIAKRIKGPERKKLDSLISKYKVETKDTARESLFNETLKELKTLLDAQDRPFLLKVLHDIKNFFKFEKKKIEDEEKDVKLEEKKQERLEKEEEKKEEKEQKKLDKKEERKDKTNRRQKQLKKFIKKQSVQDGLLNPRISNIIQMYLTENGDEYGDL